MYQQVLDPLFGSLGWSALAAAVPLLMLFVLLGVVRMAAWKASLISLATALLVAVAVYPMPVDQAVLSAVLGAAFGFFPILWIVINALWIYDMTVDSGHFHVLQRSFSRISDDRRIQAVIIAFCFGALLEALAGFGAPVAITTVMLMALGFTPLVSAVVALVANTAPVAFGALAAPLVTLSSVSGLPMAQLGAMTGRQTPVLALIVPMVLVGIIDGWRGVRQTLPATLTCGVTFGAVQFASANYVSVPLADIIAALVSAGAVLVLLRVWKPQVATTAPSTATADAPGAATQPQSDPATEVARAYAPYLIIIAVFVLAQLAPVAKALNAATVKFGWPGLHVLTASGKPLDLTKFKLDWLSTPGTLLLVAGLLTIPVLGVTARTAARRYRATWVQLRWAIVTVTAVLALAYVMNTSGQTATLGTWMAGAGGLFAAIAPLLGWLGTAVTGSDTSSNSLFGALQVTAAHRAGMLPVLAAAANGSGGVLGKMISPQNLAIAAGAVSLQGREGDIFRRVLPWSVLFVVLMCLVVYLQSTPVLSWMVV